MEADRVLDAAHYPAETRLVMKSDMSLMHWIHIVFLFCLFFAGCSLPRIIVLDDPLSPEEHLDLGVAYEKQGEFDLAVSEYQHAAGKLPAAYLYIGNVYFQKHEMDQAERYYRKAIREDPGNADAYNNLAWLYSSEKRNLQEAERLALKALELNPAKADIYNDTLKRIRDLTGSVSD